jgi:hypothetical protein
VDPVDWLIGDAALAVVDAVSGKVVAHQMTWSDVDTLLTLVHEASSLDAR